MNTRCKILAGAMATLLRRCLPVVIGVPRPVIGLAALGAELVGRPSGTVPMFNRDNTRELRCPAWTCSTERAAADLGFEPTISLRTGVGPLWTRHRSGDRMPEEEQGGEHRLSCPERHGDRPQPPPRKP